MQHRRHGFGFQCILRTGGVRQRSRRKKSGRTGEAAHQFGRLRALVLVPDAQRYAGDIKIGRVGEDEHLDQRRKQEHVARFFVAPQRGEFFQDKGEDALEHGKS